MVHIVENENWSWLTRDQVRVKAFTSNVYITENELILSINFSLDAENEFPILVASCWSKNFFFNQNLFAQRTKIIDFMLQFL